MERSAKGGRGGAGKPDSLTDFGLYRAAFLRAGVSPICVGQMSLYELESMLRSMAKLDAKSKGSEPMTPERMNAMKGKWASMNLPDVKVN